MRCRTCSNMEVQVRHFTKFPYHVPLFDNETTERGPFEQAVIMGKKVGKDVIPDDLTPTQEKRLRVSHQIAEEEEDTARWAAMEAQAEQRFEADIVEQSEEAYQELTRGRSTAKRERPGRATAGLPAMDIDQLGALAFLLIVLFGLYLVVKSVASVKKRVTPVQNVPVLNTSYPRGRGQTLPDYSTVYSGSSPYRSSTANF